ncbi:bifunctional 2',3'-cyclic-nucleotide 2'-phosphodiesterase/3'-nucleotidase [Anaerolineales bacterium HSG6]|nr:bifunctional 2',3'-cyclic-nucleotide 2'-phosphodiesterase/3'-nucleotidase [Anaerolineales bacterium HSG6]MDM8530829.1 bifunctional 2',3'-cyclic-nucleotide 2'-phosphodiesterase/3'-nucleotidase [Anaerolineales bacterium HSG25]
MKRITILISLLALAIIMVSSTVNAAPVLQTEGEDYVVQADDWLSKIAERFYGDVSAWEQIVEATNAKAAEDGSYIAIEDANIIEVGRKLWIPVPSDDQAMTDESAEAVAEEVIEETAESMTSGDATISLRLMETSDLHVNLINYDYFRDEQNDGLGLAKTATLIKQARAEATNSLLIDNGDLIQGSPMGDYIARSQGLNEGQVHPVYKVMNQLGYDVGNIGNHEFNYGLEYLGQALAGADFPYVSANAYDANSGEPYFTPYIIQDKTFVDNAGNEHTLKVGFIGFLPPKIMQWDKTNLEGQLTVEDVVVSAEKYIPEMKAEGAELVIVAAHAELDMSEGENSAYYLSQVPDIDALLLGHVHQVFPSSDFADTEGIDVEVGTINGVPAVMPGFWGNHLGVIDLTLEQVDGAWQVTSSQSVAQPISERVDRKTVSLVETDQAVIDVIQAEHEATLEWIRQPFGETTAPIHSFFALVQDDPSIQIVTDAQKWYVEKLIQGTEYDGMPVLSVGAPFKAGRGGAEDFTEVPAGVIAFKNVADLYIYPNTLKVMKLTGPEVREWLEMSAGQFNQIDTTVTDEQSLINDEFPTYNFDVVDGVTYEIDVTQPARYDTSGELVAPDSHRVINLAYDGQPVADDQVFVVATNNYRAGGGGSFPGISSDKIIIDAPDANRQVLANYIAELGTVNPSADSNWKFTTVDGVNVVFRTSPSETTVTLSEAFSNMAPTGTVNDEGFAIYSLDLSQ